MEAPSTLTPAAEDYPQWASLPPGVLQHIFCKATAWQTPGPSRAAPVCSSWRFAAAGCRGIRLLYNAGRPASDQSLAAWLGCNSRQLDTFTLTSSTAEAMQLVLGALADASAGAVAAGRPLPLHTLRVLGHGCSPGVAGRLLAGLPRLSYLQLPDFTRHDLRINLLDDGPAFIMRNPEDLQPLLHATQLEELYITTYWYTQEDRQALAQLLPLNLRHLSWRVPQKHIRYRLPDLSHLTQLTSLQLSGAWSGEHLLVTKFPAGLQELELVNVTAPEQLVLEQPQLVTGCGLLLESRHQLSRLSNLQTMCTNAAHMNAGSLSNALGQLKRLSALSMYSGAAYPLTPPLYTAASIQGLKRLDLSIRDSTPPPTGLSNLRGLTRFALSVQRPCRCMKQLDRWAAELGRAGALVWLAVPIELLIEVQRPWLGGLQQLRVLQVRMFSGAVGVHLTPRRSAWSSCRRRLARWLHSDSLCAVLPQLLLLMVTDVVADGAARLQLRHRLQQLVGSSGCEVAVTSCDPAQQLAGLPQVLQQALA